ncbi:MAG: AI-2E family transporter [Spirochaetes bacterium]|nr:AI-2E family transporter [Spirochaetota bacterium]
MKLDRSYSFLDFSRFLPYVFFGLFLFLLGLVSFVYYSYIYAFFISGILFILFRTPHRWLLKRLDGRRTMAAVISTLSVILILIIPAIFLAIALVTEARHASDLAREWFTPEKMLEIYRNNPWIQAKFGITVDDLGGYRLQLLEVIRSNQLETLKQGWKWALTSIKFVVDFTFALFILFFLFRSVDRIGLAVYRNLPFPDKIEKHIGERMVKIFDAVVKGNLVVSALQGAVIGIVFWLCGLSTPLLWGAVAAPFALIPVIGTAVVWLPGAIYLYSHDQHTTAIIMAITCMTFYFLLENLLKPMLLDRDLNLHPLFLFLAIVGGLNAFGVKGLILGPFIVTMFVTIWELISEWNGNFTDQDPGGSATVAPPAESGVDIPRE